MTGDRCNCIDLLHDHPKGACPNAAPPTGVGVCDPCRYYEPTPPGSRAAKARGCLCPVIDNGHGFGYLGQPGVYVMMFDCPLHGRK